MKIKILYIKEICIAEIISESIEISGTRDTLDLIANCNYQGARKIIIKEKNIIPDFFHLKTGIAGEILQKFSTYNVQLAIIGDYQKYSSKSLKDFIYESNKTGRIYFVNSVDEAKEKLIRE